MSQPPPADDHEGAASRPATPSSDQPEPKPSPEHSEESDQTQRVEVTPPAQRQAPEPDPNADVTQRVELPTHTSGAEPSASAIDTGQAAATGRAPAATSTPGAGRTETDDTRTQTDDTRSLTDDTPRGSAATERREQQWPPDDSADTPPTGMRALPRRQPWEDMETPAHGIPAQRPPAAQATATAVRPAVRRDRLWVHFGWEALLVLGVALSALLLGYLDGDPFTDESSLRNLALQVGILGLLASGLALSLRVAAPNLAVGSVATAAGVGLVWLLNDRNEDLTAAVGLVLLAAAGAGLVLAIVVVGLNVPAWAATLGAAAALDGAAFAVYDGRLVGLDSQAGQSVIDQGWLWFGVFAAISVVGGALWAIPAVRDRLSGTRSERDPAARPGAAAGLGATLGLVGSCVLAAGSGILLTLTVRAPGTSSFMLLAALGAALLGGVSVFGRRAGVFGTLLAVIVIVLLREALVVGQQGAVWKLGLLAAAAILVGLAVTRVLEVAGRRRTPV